MERGRRVEEVVSRTRASVSRRRQDEFPACPRIRLGRIWEHRSVSGLEPEGFPHPSGTVIITQLYHLIVDPKFYSSSTRYQMAFDISTLTVWSTAISKG